MAEATPQPKRKRTALYVLLAFLLLVIVAGLAAFVLIQNKRLSQFEAYAFTSGGVEPQASAKAEPDPYSPGAASRHVFVPFEMFTSNLSGTDSDRFVQVGVSLEVKDEQHKSGVAAVMPVLRSEILLLLSSKRVTDLSTLDGKQQLSRDILDIARRYVSPELNRGIYAAHFSNFVIQ